MLPFPGGDPPVSPRPFLSLLLVETKLTI
jgi:hypothetical protein